MLIVLLIVAAVGVSAPVVGCVLISVASRREDSECSLGNRAPGHVQAWARRILGFHSDAPNCFRRRRSGQTGHLTSRDADSCRVAAEASGSQGREGHQRLHRDRQKS